MRKTLVALLALTCLTSVGCRRWLHRQLPPAGRFHVVSVHRTTAAHPNGEDLVVRVNELTGESWLLIPTEWDGRPAERWVRVAEPIKEIEEPTTR
jgi:hypothetical protein